VADWLASRQQREQKKVEKAAGKKPPDPEAKAKREAQRARRVADGLDVLETWLLDQVTEGLAAAPAKPGAFWGGTAAAMVNAQAPGWPEWCARPKRWRRAGTGGSAACWSICRGCGCWRGAGWTSCPRICERRSGALLGYTVSREEALEAGEGVVDRWAA
jgi:hypothetical protein